MLARVHTVALFCALQLCGSGTAASEPSCEDGGDGACPTQGSSHLQARMREKLIVASEEEEEKKQSVTQHIELEKEEKKQSVVQHIELEVETKIVAHRGYEIITHSAEPGTRTWLLRQPHCSTSTLDQFVENLDDSCTLIHEGNPDAGGMCLLIINATLPALKEELSEHHWPINVTVEEDVRWGLVPGVDSVESHGEPNLLQGSPGYTNLWGLDRIDQRNVGQDYSFRPPNTGRGVHVFVADTGVRITHVDFEGRAFAGVDLTVTGSEGTPIDCSTSSLQTCSGDRNGHGTHCAGTIGGKTYGVAKEVTLHAVKVLSDQGGGQFSWFVEGVEYAEMSHLRPAVLSASLGGRIVLPSVKQAIDDAVAKGVVVVVAAGNDGFTSYPDACDYSPAHVPSAITVGSTEIDDDRSGFSNWGSCVDIFAPGTDIKSAYYRSDTDEKTLSGTSMACPHVAGVVALMLEHNPSLSVAQATQLLKVRASQGKVHDVRGGAPNLLLYSGLDHAPPTPPPPPTTPTTSTTTTTTTSTSTTTTRGVVAPMNCGFESLDLCHVWWQAPMPTDTMDWTRHSGGTASYNTGPSVAAEGSYYLYTEASGRQSNVDYAILESSPFLLNGGTLEFSYHMYGGTIGSLKVEVDGTEVWSKSGGGVDRWYVENIPLGAYVGGAHVIAFVGHIGASYTGDIAIDDVKFLPGATTIVAFGPSGPGNNHKCVNTAPFTPYCASNAGDPGIRVNFDASTAPDTFIISRDPVTHQTCAHRTDSSDAWLMDLRVRCSLTPIPTVTPPTTVAPPQTTPPPPTLPPTTLPPTTLPPTTLPPTAPPPTTGAPATTPTPQVIVGPPGLPGPPGPPGDVDLHLNVTVVGQLGPPGSYNVTVPLSPGYRSNRRRRLG